MFRLTVLALALATTAGCIVYGDRDVDVVEVVTVPTNALPEVLDAAAGCFYDPYNGDDILWFDAIVDDRDGPFDVVEVWADVYDAYTDSYIESFPLDPTDDPYVWFSDWLSSTTLTNCAAGGYNVDIVAIDSFGDSSAIFVQPYNYGVAF